MDKVESVIKQMRLESAFFFFTNTYDTKDNMNKETYGFKSKHHFGIKKGEV